MRGMAKPAGEESPKVQDQHLRSRRRRPSAEASGYFMKAFADALRDILREERRRAA